MLDYLNSSMRIMFTLAFTLVAVLTLVACGQKGNLYLPNIPPAPHVMSIEKQSETVLPQEAFSEELPDQKADKDKNKVTAESNEHLPAAEAEK